MCTLFSVFFVSYVHHSALASLLCLTIFCTVHSAQKHQHVSNSTWSFHFLFASFIFFLFDRMCGWIDSKNIPNLWACSLISNFCLLLCSYRAKRKMKRTFYFIIICILGSFIFLSSNWTMFVCRLSCLYLFTSFPFQSVHFSFWIALFGICLVPSTYIYTLMPAVQTYGQTNG